MKIARPILVTDDKLSLTNVLENDYSEWSGSSVSYALNDRVIHTTTHKVYECRFAHTSSSTYDPSTWVWSGTGNVYWLEVSATNAWKMFDSKVTAQTERLGNIDVTIVPGEPVDSISFINVDAATVTVTVTDALEGVVYTLTDFSLVNASGITDWYAYFFTPIERSADYFLSGLPLYANATIRVLLEAPETVKCGELVLGRTKDVGYTQYGAGVGIQDYSIKEANQWGDYAITQRAFSKLGDFTVIIEPDSVDALQIMLASYRAVPAVYVGADDFGSTLLFGFYKDFALEIAYPSYAVCTLQVEGLT